MPPITRKRSAANNREAASAANKRAATADAVVLGENQQTATAAAVAAASAAASPDAAPAAAAAPVAAEAAAAVTTGVSVAVQPSNNMNNAEERAEAQEENKKRAAKMFAAAAARTADLPVPRSQIAADDCFECGERAAIRWLVLCKAEDCQMLDKVICMACKIETHRNHDHIVYTDVLKARDVCMQRLAVQEGVLVAAHKRMMMHVESATTTLYNNPQSFAARAEIREKALKLTSPNDVEGLLSEDRILLEPVVAKYLGAMELLSDFQQKVQTLFAEDNVNLPRDVGWSEEQRSALREQVQEAVRRNQQMANLPGFDGSETVKEMMFTLYGLFYLERAKHVRGMERREGEVIPHGEGRQAAPIAQEVITLDDE